MSTDATTWSIAMYVGVGLGVFLIGLSSLIAALRLAVVLKRVGTTLDEVDRQLATLSGPLAQTLSHVGGIADTADATVARLSGVVGSLESVAASVTKTATLAQEALAPSIVNLGATLAGTTAAVRRLVSGNRTEPGESV
jgi:uncharacterized protein YoxC